MHLWLSGLPMRLRANGLPMGLRLNGFPVLLRPIRPEDAARVQSFVRALSPQSRRSRFLSGLSELVPYMLQRLTQPDHPREFGLIALAGGPDACSVVGMAN